MSSKPLGITERLARASARRPRRTLALWGLTVVAALVLVGTALHGLTSNAHVVGSPESTKAAKARVKAFPPSPAEAKRDVSDVVVVSSARYRVDAPPFRAFVAHLDSEIRVRGA